MALDSCAFGWSTCEVYIELDFSEEVCVDNSDCTLFFSASSASSHLWPYCFNTSLFNGNFVQNIMLIAIALLFLGFDNPVLAAVSNAVTFKNPNEPLHGHLALTGNPTEMR